MKKILISLVLVLAFVSVSFAAGTVTFTKEEYTTVTGESWFRIKAEVTFDGAAAAPADTDLGWDMRGYYLYYVVTDPGSTGPTDNSDFTLDAGSATGYDALGGAGANAIDNATNNYFMPLIGSDQKKMPIMDSTLYLDINNNAVNSATVDIFFYFVAGPK